MEKYGEIPPKFTKEWWDYFWYYYKWRVIIIAAAIIIAAVTIVQCANRPRYDMTVVYAGHKNYSETEKEKLTEILEEYISDIDDNGKKAIFFQPLMFSDSAGNEEYDYAIQTKLDMTFMDDYTYIYLLDEAEAALYANRQNIASTFENAELFAKDSDAEIIKGNDGNGYAVSLKDSSILRENGIFCDDLYISVRIMNSNDEKDSAAHSDALKIAEALIK